MKIIKSGFTRHYIYDCIYSCICAPLLFATLAIAGCGEGQRRGADDADSNAGNMPERFHTEVLNAYTPVKNQGRAPLCWAYAMLSAIETEHIMRGDSVHLSVKYAARALAEDNFRRAYFTCDRSPSTMRATAQTLLDIIARHGLVAYDAYHDTPRNALHAGHDTPEADYDVLMLKLRRLARKAVNMRLPLRRAEERAAALIDETLGPAPRNVFMLGARYTPGEFARSVCAPDEYIALTSFTHHPFYETFPLEVPDNWAQSEMLNVPMDTLVERMERAVRRGRGVCWEGDTNEAGFSFDRGTASLPAGTDVSQAARQLAFERHETTDEHCMAVVGLARDTAGRLWFIMKSSWGTANLYGGLMYVSGDYVRLKTIAVFMPRSAWEDRG